MVIVKQQENLKMSLKKRRHGHNITQPVTDLGSQPVTQVMFGHHLQ